MYRSWTWLHGSIRANYLGSDVVIMVMEHFPLIYNVFPNESESSRIQRALVLKSAWQYLAI